MKNKLKKNIGLVVLNYNNFSETLNFINNIKSYNAISEIVVVDNNSRNESYEVLLQESNHHIHVIQSGKNGGYGYGNNFGIKYGIQNFDWEHVIISNPDVFFEEEVIFELLDISTNSNETVGLVAPLMVMSKNNSNMPTHWKLPTYKDDIMKTSLILNKIYNKFVKLKTSEIKQNGNMKKVDVLPGSFLFISTKIMKEVGFFSEKTFLYCEERILAKKLLDKGYQNILATNITYIHDHSTTISKYNTKINQFKIYNQSILIYHKYYAETSKVNLIILEQLLRLGLLEKKIIFQIRDLGVKDNAVK